MNDELIDIHVHVGPSDTGQLYYPELTQAEWADLAEASGICRAVVFPPTRDAGYLDANRTLAAWAAASEGRISAFARLGGPELPLAEPRFWLLRRAARRRILPRPDDLAEWSALQHFAGVKFLPQLDGLPGRQAFEAIADFGLAVLCHAGRLVPASWIARRVLPRTRGPVILAHLGAFPAEADLIDQALDLAEREPRVWLDTSGIWPLALLDRALARVPHKLVFGSDCPLTHPRVAWEQIARRIADPGLRRRIGHDAAMEILA